MPEGAAGSRGAQKSALAGVLYDKRTDQQLGTLLKQLKEAAAELDPVQAAVVRDAYRWGYMTLIMVMRYRVGMLYQLTWQ